MQTEHKHAVGVLPDIIGAAADMAGVQLSDVYNTRNRGRDVTLARRLAVYVAKTITIASYPAISRAYGYRGHGGVHETYRAYQAMVDCGLPIYRPGSALHGHDPAEVADRLCREVRNRLDGGDAATSPATRGAHE